MTECVRGRRCDRRQFGSERQTDGGRLHSDCRRTVYVGSYDGKFLRAQCADGALKWKFATEASSVRSKGSTRLARKTRPSPIRLMFLLQPCGGKWRWLFGAATEIFTRWTGDSIFAGNSRPAMSCTLRGARGWLLIFEAGQLFLCVDATTAKRNGGFTRRRPAQSQPGWVPIFAGDRERRRVHRLPRREFVCARCEPGSPGRVCCFPVLPALCAVTAWVKPYPTCSGIHPPSQPGGCVLDHKSCASCLAPGRCEAESQCSTGGAVLVASTFSPVKCGRRQGGLCCCGGRSWCSPSSTRQTCCAPRNKSR